MRIIEINFATYFFIFNPITLWLCLFIHAIPLKPSKFCEIKMKILSMLKFFPETLDLF